MEKFIHAPSIDKYSPELYNYRYIVKKTGIIYDLDKKRIVNINYSGKAAGSYPSVILFNKLGEKCQLVLHKLLAVYFIPNNDPLNKICVNHIDGDKLNFDLSNLEWVTSKENTKKAYSNKQMENTLLSRKIYSKKIQNELELKGRNIINMIMDGYDNDFIAKEFKVGYKYISAVRRKIKFKYLWEEMYPGSIVPKSSKEYEIKNSLINSKFSLEEELNILNNLRFNTNISLARKLNIDPSVLSRARTRSAWVESNNIFLKEKLIPLPLRPLIGVYIPEYYFMGNKELQLESFLDIITSMLQKIDINNLRDVQKLNEVCIYWCQLYFNKNTNITPEEFDILISILKTRPL